MPSVSDRLMARQCERSQSVDSAQPVRRDTGAGQSIEVTQTGRPTEPARFSQFRPPGGRRATRPPDVHPSRRPGPLLLTAQPATRAADLGGARQSRTVPTGKTAARVSGRPFAEPAGFARA